MSRLWKLGPLLAMATSVGCASTPERQYADRMMKKAAPDFELTALDGGKVRLSEFRGKPVVLAFWAFG